MAKKLKDYYDTEYLENFSNKIASVTDAFDRKRFLELTKSAINELEFKKRQVLIAKALHETINLNYDQAPLIFTKILGPELKGNSGAFSEGWWLWTLGTYAELYGGESFDTTVNFSKELTKRFTSEYWKGPIIKNLSKDYRAEKLTEDDVETIYNLCQGNKLYYRYCQAELSREQILSDLYIRPEGLREDDKYYLGFFKDEVLVAVLDILDGYPDEETCFIGFFMVNILFQGQGIGSEIIESLLAYIKKVGKAKVRLGIDKGNSQSKAFWLKNGFKVIKEVERPGGTILLAERYPLP